MSPLHLEGLQGVAPVRRELRAAAQRLEDVRALHRAAGNALAAWVRRNFAAEGRLHEDFPAGWPPLARSTLAARRRRGAGTRILDDTGRLRRGVAVEADGRRAVLGNAVPYAARHQLGRDVPRRAFLPGTAQAERIVFPVLARHVRQALAEITA